MAASFRKTRERRGLGLVWACWLVLFSWQWCQAQADFYWLGAPGAPQDWGTAANWNPSTAVPGQGDSAFLESSDANDRAAAFRSIYPPGTTLNVIRLNATGAGTMTLILAQHLPAGELRAQDIYVGDTGQGALQQSQGTINITNYLNVGNQTGATGSVALSGGSLTTNYLVLGEYGTGNLNQSGASQLTVTHDLGLGTNNGGRGTYALTGGTLQADYIYIGDNGNGTFTQSQPTASPTTVNCTGGLAVGRGGNSISSYTLSGGSLNIGNAPSMGYLWLGYAGQGTFTQTGGVCTITGDISLGESASGRGILELHGGSLVANNPAAGTLHVGGSGVGTLTQKAGSTLTLTGMFVNSQTGTSTVTQLGGSTTIANHLGVGRDANNQRHGGEYNFRGGSLQVGSLFVGHGGNGVFTQEGGNLTINNNDTDGGIFLAEEATGRGRLNLLGGTVAFQNPTMWSATMQVGGSGIGEVNQAAGVNLILENIFINSQEGVSTFTQRGDVTLNSHLGVGRDADSRGQYTLLSGNLAAQQIFLGYAGQGAMTQDGGSVNLAQDLRLGDSGRGSYHLSNGTLQTSDTLVGIGGSGSLFQQDGGSHIVANTLTLAANPGSSGTYNLSGGILQAATINLNPGGIFNQTGGNLNAATFNHQGGEVQGSLENRGAYIYQSGLFSGRLLNYGTVVFNNNFTAGNGLGHYSATPINLTDATRTITCGGQGLEIGNGATFSLADGSVRFLNSAGNGLQVRSGGTFNQTGGIVDGASNTIAIFEGSCNVSGGEYRAATLNIHTGGSFNWTGGSFTYTRLYLDGGSFTGNLTNRGWLGGRGTLNGTVTNQGTVSPGASAGTLQVVGSFSQSAAGRYVCEIASASSYDRIVVTGTPATAALNGVLAPTLLGGFQPTRGQIFPGIVTAAGGITGTFAQVESSNLWKVIYNPTSVDLMAFPFRDFTDPNLGLSWNQFQVGQLLNGLTATAQGDLETVLGALSDLPDQQVPKGLQKLTPDQNASLANLSFAASRMQGRSLIDRMNFLRQGEGAAAGDTGDRLGGRPGLSASRLNGVLLAYNGASLSGLFSGRPPAKQQPWGLFANFVGTLGTQDTTARQIGYSYNIFGFNTGLDYRLRPDLIIGGATGYYHTSSWFKDNGGEASVHSIPFSFYGVYHPGNFYLIGSLGYTLNLYNLDRTVAFGTVSRTAQSSLSASQLNLAWETGYDLKLARLIITPAANLFYSTVWLPAHTETGAGSVNLRVGAQTADSLQTGIGARCRYPTTVGQTRITPQFSAFYQHEFANSSRILDARLSQTGGAFSFQTEAPTRNFAVLGAGLEVQCGENLFLQATYNAEVGREHTTAHYLNAGLRWEF